MIRKILSSRDLSRDFESVVSTISPLRHCWLSATFRGFLRNYSGLCGTIRTVTVHKSVHNEIRTSRAGGILPRLLCALLCLSPILAQAEAYIAFEPIKSGNLSFESVALNVDGAVLFSPANGAVFYKDGTVQRGLPVWGSCYSYPAVYICTFETGEYSFRIRLEKATKKGLIWPVSSNFDAMGSREAALVEVVPQRSAL